MLLTPSSHSTCRVQEARWLHKRIRPACFERRGPRSGREGAFIRSGQPDRCGRLQVPLLLWDKEVVRTQFAWDHVSFNKYIAALQKAEISTAGILVKILRLRNFLDYILSALQPTAEEEKQIQKMVDMLKKYHCHFAKGCIRWGSLYFGIGLGLWTSFNSF